MSKLKRNSRPTDVNQAAYAMVQRTAEESERPRTVKVTVKVPPPSKAEISRVMSVIGRKGGKKGGKRSLITMTPEQRRERALLAARARWKNKKPV
jgi:hypothetical protein